MHKRVVAMGQTQRPASVHHSPQLTNSPGCLHLQRSSHGCREACAVLDAHLHNQPKHLEPKACT